MPCFPVKSFPLFIFQNGEVYKPAILTSLQWSVKQHLNGKAQRQICLKDMSLNFPENVLNPEESSCLSNMGERIIHAQATWELSKTE